MEKYLVSVRAEVDLYVEAENENDAYELALDKLYSNPDKLISEADMEASIEE